MTDNLSTDGEHKTETWNIQRILSSGAEQNITNMFDSLMFEEDRLIQSQPISKPTSHNAFISKQGNKSGKYAGRKKSLSGCLRCSKTGYRKSYYRGKAAEKYLGNCKNINGSSKCKCRGHFVKDCANTATGQQKEKSS